MTLPLRLRGGTVDLDGHRGEFLDLPGRVAEREDLALVLVTHNATAVRRLAGRGVHLDRRVRAWGTPAGILDALLSPLAEGLVRRALAAGLALSAASPSGCSSAPASVARSGWRLPSRWRSRSASSVLGTAFGLQASYHLNVATGATIILTLGAAFFLALVARRR